MTTRSSIVRHRFGGGWATDFGPTAEVTATQNGLVTLPWLNDAKNVEFVLDGGIRKVGGTQKLNSTALESGAQIYGLYDYWRLGTAGTPTQKRVIHVGTKIKKDDADGSFSDIKTGQTDGAVPSYALFDDDLIIMNDALADVPLIYDQTTCSTLGTNTPDIAFGVTHKNRFWGAGDPANPSTVYYSPALPNGANGDWDNGGQFQIDPGDGDKVTALASFKEDLWIFKGPYKGSIHRILGSAPTASTGDNTTIGDVAFSKKVFVRGLGSANHNSLFRFQDDLGFVWTDGSVHSLNATAAFGDFREASLSLPINDFLKERVNLSLLKYAWATTLNGVVIITLPIDTSTDNNVMLCMDFRFMPVENQPRWSYWDHIGAACVATVVDSTNSNKPTLFTGGNDGFVRRMDRDNRSVDGTTAYTCLAETPFVHYGTPMRMKTLENAAVGVSPRGDYNMTLGWTMDNNTRNTDSLSQGAGDVLASGGSSGSITAFADAGGGQVTVTSAGHTVAENAVVVIYGTTNYNGQFTATNVVAATSFEITATWVADDATGTWETMNEANPFILGTSTLAAAQYRDIFFNLESAGEFRSIQYDVQQGGNNQDMEVHSITAEISGLTTGALSLEN